MKAAIWIGITLIMFSCSIDSKEFITPQLFENPSSKSTGLAFTNTLTESDSLNILDYLYFYNGGGVAVGDINNDGLPDIYLSGNQIKNKLYLNKGNLKFEDITQTAQVAGNSTWNTGTIMLDANQDGLLDIYVCAVVGISNFKGHNELFINNGDTTFTESAKEYGLDFKTFSTTAAVLDYDKDGDLDLYLLNHAVHTQESYGSSDLRYTRSAPSSDKLLRNDGGTFTEVSEQMGLIGGINSYGLGVSVADFNQDGWPDIYVGNDFHEDDYYYINEGGVRFRESLRENFGHTSRFSMGNDVADINHDGYPDLVSLDMAPENEIVLKSSEGDDNIQTQRLRVERFRYHYQFTRNMLYINQPGYQYREQALSSGIAATDWSWSSLFADFNNDTYQDLFISNGIPKRPNDLDFINFISNTEIKNRLNQSRLIDQEALAKMPSGSVANYVYQGMEDYTFKDRSKDWTDHRPSVSGATALADLDNDGDVDLVVNTVNEVARIYHNQTNGRKNWLKLKLDDTKNNRFGIGTKVYLYATNKQYYKELYTARGFQASSEPIVHFGLGDVEVVDSIKIIWPNNSYQLVKNVKANQLLEIRPLDVKTSKPDSIQKPVRLFSKTTTNLGIDFTHIEDTYLDFNRQKLIPFRISDRGPATAIGDINGDGLDDVYFGSSKFKPSAIYIQNEGAFAKAYTEKLQKLYATEDKTAHIQDRKIFVGTAGGEYAVTNPRLEDYIIQLEDNLELKLSDIRGNTAILAPSDYDGDGDLDLFVGHHAIAGDYGNIPASYVLRNDRGVYHRDTTNDLGELGMVTQAIWSDFTGDGVDDLVVIGEWMTVQFYENKKGLLKRVKVQSERLKGLWQAIEPFDIDQDGDLDYLLGNWGTNSKFTATLAKPLKMYYSDFDKNGQTETVIATSKQGQYYPIQGLTGLSEQIIRLKKKYPDHRSFAGQTVAQIFGKYELENATLLEVHTLASGYLKNERGIFTFVPFPSMMQVAPILDFVTSDFDGDGLEEVLAGGNYFGVKPYHGRLDSFPGALIKDEKTIIEGYKVGLDFAQKSVRHLNILRIDKKDFLLVTFNNKTAEVYQINK